MSQLGFEEERVEYARATLTEIAARESNGLTAVGSFSGAGGSSLGLRMAGWSVPYAIEFVEAAADSYAANASEGSFVDRRDIRKIEATEILDHLGLEPGELDLFEGSPPCASFSAAGTGHRTRERPCDKCKGSGVIHATILDSLAAKKCDLCGGSGRLAGVAKSYSDTTQETHDLFWEWMRLLDGLRPRAFIAENVPGMLRGEAAEYAEKIIGDLSALGYRVSWKVLQAQWYGTPQIRPRLIFLGLRRDVSDAAPEFPGPTVDPPFTLGDALHSAEHLCEPGEKDEVSMESYAVGRLWRFVREARAAGREFDPRTVDCQRCGKPLPAHSIEKTAQDGTIAKARCEDGEPADIIKDYFMAVVPNLDRPCPTITATAAQVGAASVCHPTECRKFTAEELKAICGFPPDFELTGTPQQRRERMGRAVPPPMYQACGQKLAEYLRGAE